MMLSPSESASRMMKEMKELVSIHEDEGEGFQEKAKALAAVWMEKGAAWMEECRAAGAKFTEDEKEKE